MNDEIDKQVKEKIERMKIAIAASVRLARTKKKMTQEELARRSGLTNHTICVMEKKTGAQCSLETLTSVCAVLGIEMNLVQPSIPVWQIVSAHNNVPLTEETFGSEEDALKAIKSDVSLTGGVPFEINGEEFTVIVKQANRDDNLILHVISEPTKNAIIEKVETAILDHMIKNGYATKDDTVSVVSNAGYEIISVIHGKHENVFEDLPSVDMTIENKFQ